MFLTQIYYLYKSYRTSDYDQKNLCTIGHKSTIYKLETKTEKMQKYIPFIDFTLANKEEATLLGKLANAILTSKENSLVNTPIALKIGIINQDGNFLADDAKNFFYTLNFLETKFGVSSEGEFCSVLLAMLQDTSRKHLDLKIYDWGGLIVLISNRIFTIDVANVIYKNSNFSKVSRMTLFVLLPYLRANNTDLIDALILASDDTAEVNFISLNKSLQRISHNNPEFAYELVESVKNHNRLSNLYMPHVFYGLTENKGLGTTLKSIMIFIDSDDAEHIKLGLFCLRVISNLTNEVVQNKDELKTILSNLRVKAIEGTLSGLMCTYGCFVPTLDFSSNAIIEIFKSFPSEETVISLAYVLSLNVEKSYNDDWFSEGMSLVIRSKKYSEVYYKYLTDVFVELFVIQPDKTYEYLKEFILYDGSKNLSSIEYFFHIMSATHLYLLQKWITLWLNHENDQFHLAARELSCILSSHHIHEIELDQEILKELSVYDVEFILYKILGNVHVKEHLQSLTFSATNFTGKGYKAIGKLYSQMCVLHILYNYPSSLKYLLEKKGKSKYQNEIVKELEETYNNMYMIKQDKPQEFLPSPKRLQMLTQQKFKKYNMDKVKPEKNTFLNTIREVDIKSGKYFFSRDEKGFDTLDEFRHKVELTTFEAGIELPSQFRIDPVGFEISMLLAREFERRG